MSEFWNERYSQAGYLFGEEPSAFINRHAHWLLPGSNVLLPADGEGRNSVYLARLGHKVTATDSSHMALAKAEKLARANRVSVDLRLGDIFDYEWPHESFDAIISVFIQFASPIERKAIFEGMKRAVRPGGLILLHGYTPEQLQFKTGGPSQAENLYTEQLLQEAFHDFRIEFLVSYHADLREGEGHNGTSALIDMVAVKAV